MLSNVIVTVAFVTPACPPLYTSSCKLLARTYSIYKADNVDFCGHKFLERFKKKFNDLLEWENKLQCLYLFIIHVLYNIDRTLPQALINCSKNMFYKSMKHRKSVLYIVLHM